jgi:hypothetical protein
MAQREDFEVESGARPHNATERHQNRYQQGRRRGESLALAADKFNSDNAYGVFRSDRVVDLCMANSNFTQSPSLRYCGLQ